MPDVGICFRGLPRPRIGVCKSVTSSICICYYNIYTVMMKLAVNKTIG